jgi:hypothetical protein
MLWLPILAWALASQGLGAFAVPFDVTSMTISAPMPIADLDLGKLKGDLREVAWSPDGAWLYLQTADGNPPNAKLHHYLVEREKGSVQPADAQPDWAQKYWTFKSDRTAPGVPTLEIEVKQSREDTKIGVGSARPGSMASGRGADAAENASMAGESQRNIVWKFLLLDQTISEFKDTRPIPGLMFSWGPRGSSTIAYTDSDGRLLFLDGERRHRTVASVKDATLPAWSEDGSRIAYAVKQGRKKYQLVWCTITR